MANRPASMQCNRIVKNDALTTDGTQLSWLDRNGLALFGPICKKSKPLGCPAMRGCSSVMFQDKDFSTKAAGLARQRCAESPLILPGPAIRTTVYVQHRMKLRSAGSGLGCNVEHRLCL